MKIVKLLGWMGWMGLMVLIPMTASHAAINDFAGLWRNVDTNTRGITRLSIEVTGPRAKLHTWAACRPKECDWGAVTARLGADKKLKAYYQNSFSERILVLTKTGAADLKVEMLTRYTDNSGRPNRTAIYRFKRRPTFGEKPTAPIAKPNFQHQTQPKKRAGIAGQLNTESETKNETGSAGQGIGAVENRPSSLQVVYPKGGEELRAGHDMTIQWKSAKEKKRVSLILMVENLLAKTNIPIIITKNAPNTGKYRYRLPFKWNSRLGFRFRVVVQEGKFKSTSQAFSVYPRIDLVVQYPKVRFKKKGKKWAKWVAAAATGTPLPLIQRNSHIEVEFQLRNMGIDIIKSRFMSKVAVRLSPGNAELNSAGFSHHNIIPGRKYTFKAKIDPKDWNMTPGMYRLDVWVDPQNNTNEHVKLRDNNRAIIAFQVK